MVSKLLQQTIHFEVLCDKVEVEKIEKERKEKRKKRERENE